MKNCVIYCRQSSGDNDISESVEIQKQKCAELAEKENLNIIGVYSDLNTSGKCWPKGSEKIAENDIAFINWYAEQAGHKKYRPGFGNALAHLSEIDFIVCYDITRLYRPVTGSFLESYINQLLITNNVKLFTVNNGIIDVSKFSDALITSIQNQINHEQLAIQRKKSMDATKKLKNNGELYNGLWNMHGYKSTGRKREIEIDEIEVDMIREIYSTFLNTDSLMETTRRINTKYSHIVKTVLHPSSYKNILQHPAYCGYMYDSNNNLIKCKQLIGKEIISFNDWQEVQKRFELRKTSKPRNKKYSYPLSSLVYCGKCGGKMLITKGKYNKFYRCVKSQRLKTSPCGTNIYNSYNNKLGLGLIEAIYPLLSLSILDRLNTSMNKEENQIELNNVEVKLTNLKNKEKNITDVYLNGILDENIYKETLMNIKKEKNELIDKISKLKNIINNGEEFIQKAMMLLDKITFKNLTYAEYKSCLFDVIKRIDIFEDKINIKTSYGDLTLPRQKIHLNRTTLPHYYFFPHKESILVYYYLGEEVGAIFNSNFKNNQHELIGDFNKLKVYLIK